MQTAPESLFWYWIAERHAIYLRRAAGLPKPWTDDSILQNFKFTNPFRENDRGTVWLRENFLEPHRDDTETGHVDYRYTKGERSGPDEPFTIEKGSAPCPYPGGECRCGQRRHALALMAFNICWYRMFNWWGTGELLGWQTDWNERVSETLHEAAERGEQVFTGAHIVYSPPGRPKIDAIVDVCLDLYYLCMDPCGSWIGGATLQGAFDQLKTVRCVGGFMAYEMVSDMRHTRVLEHATDIMSWANMGPGAKRGLTRLGMPCRNQEEGCESMRELLSRSWERYLFAVTRDMGGVIDATEHSGLVPKFEMRDIEHSLCEFDKYCRVKFGEGKPRSMYSGRA